MSDFTKKMELYSKQQDVTRCSEDVLIAYREKSEPWIREIVEQIKNDLLSRAQGRHVVYNDMPNGQKHKPHYLASWEFAVKVNKDYPLLEYKQITIDYSDFSSQIMGFEFNDSRCIVYIIEQVVKRLQEENILLVTYQSVKPRSTFSLFSKSTSSTMLHAHIPENYLDYISKFNKWYEKVPHSRVNNPDATTFHLLFSYFI